MSNERLPSSATKSSPVTDAEAPVTAKYVEESVRFMREGVDQQIVWNGLTDLCRRFEKASRTASEIQHTTDAAPQVPAKATSGATASPTTDSKAAGEVPTPASAASPVTEHETMEAAPQVPLTQRSERRQSPGAGCRGAPPAVSASSLPPCRYPHCGQSESLCGTCDRSSLPSAAARTDLAAQLLAMADRYKTDYREPVWRAAAEALSAPSSGRVATHPCGLWMVYFEDAAAHPRPEVFFGEGAEAAARKRYESAKDHWSCHLLSRIPTGTEDDKPSYAAPAVRLTSHQAIDLIAEVFEKNQHQGTAAQLRQYKGLMQDFSLVESATGGKKS